MTEAASNRQKLLAAIDKRRADPKFTWLMGELEHFQNLNDEREPEDKCADDAELFMSDIADKADDTDASVGERQKIRTILIDAGFYRPFDEKAWREGRIAVSGGKPWDFTQDGVKYDGDYTYFDFLGDDAA